MPRDCRIFSVAPRTGDAQGFWRDVCTVADLSERFRLTGVLLFTGNDSLLEPWVAAQELLRRTSLISPLVAVNPVYMHPFAVAKTIASLVQLYGRRIFLNMVIGTALSHQTALGDLLSHDERYARLAEHIDIVKRLLTSRRPLTFVGEHYRVDQLQLFPGIAPEIAPEFLLAGQSEAARRVCAVTGSTAMQMLPALLEDVLSDVPGVHFGIVSRRTTDAAWKAARRLFPEDPEDRAMLESSMANTDASWKRRMKAHSEHAREVGDYWLTPFANSRADCPYVVGSHGFVIHKLRHLVAKGINTFVLDIPPNEDEFTNVHYVLKAGDLIA